MQDKKFNFTRLVLLFFQGAIIGTGAILPGISGGVLCVAFGLYEPMVGLFAHPWQSLRRNYQLFLPLFLGCGLGFLLLARVVEHLLTAAAAITLALFAGLICGTIPSLMKKSELSGPNTGWGSFVISLSLSYFLFHLLDSSAGGSIQPNWGWYFFCGAVWAFSMILPGLSSSSLLLFLGLYQPMAEGIGHLHLRVLIPLALGFVATLLLCARAVDRLMQRHYALVSRILLGFVISSALTIFPTSRSKFFYACFALPQDLLSPTRWMPAAIEQLNLSNLFGAVRLDRSKFFPPLVHHRRRCLI